MMWNGVSELGEGKLILDVMSLDLILCLIMALSLTLVIRKLACGKSDRRLNM